MIYTAKIKEAKRETSIPDKKEYLNISFEIILDEKPIADRSISFPLESTEKEIEDEIKKYCKMFENDHKLAKESAERLEAESKAEETINKIKNKEIK
jgi:hypothetical protein